jgi:SnoaL-like domain
MPADPAAVLALAIEAAVTGDPALMESVFTDDVVAWSPNMSVTSLAELEEEFADRDEALSNVVFSVDALDVVATKAIAEWRLAADHTGALRIDDDLVIEPTGRTIVLAGATFAEFRGDQICAWRTYFDDAALIEQLMIGD